MKFAVLSLATDKMREIRELTFPNKQAYCERHGYKWISSAKSLDLSRPSSWSKILMIQQVCLSRSVDWAFWTDADSLIVRPEWKLESIADDNADFIVSKDVNGINCGVFMMRMGGMTQQFLLAVYDHVEYLNHRYWEQAAIRRELDLDFPFRVKFADKTLINAYPNDFREGHSAVIHVPNSPEIWPDRIGELKKRLPV
jgi:galactosyl transferase GMA12/MNN10 family